MTNVAIVNGMKIGRINDRRIGSHMTEFKDYEFAGFAFKTYYKTAGKGYEVGLTSGGKTYFVGNFINAKEARKWWTSFNKYVASFYRKFDYSKNAPREFYGKFMGNFLYQEYYKFLDTLFSGYNTYYTKAFTKNFKQYEKIMKDFEA